MLDIMEYKGYAGSVETYWDDYTLCGRILAIEDLSYYEGDTLKELESNFHHLVDKYIQDQKELQEELSCLQNGDKTKEEV